MSPITVAIIGATGNVGTPLIKTLLSKEYHPEKVAKVLFFSRDPASAKAKELVALGAEAVQSAGNSISADQLKGVDVLVAATPTSLTTEDKNAFAKAAVDAGVKVYFAPEYGSDTSFSKVKHTFFTDRQRHLEDARKIGQGRLKVIALSTGAFLEYLLSPFFGIDIKNKVSEAWGSPDVKMSTTAINDIAHAIAQTAVLAANDPNSVPDDIRIQGDVTSHQEVADLVSKESGESIKVVGGDYDAIKKDLDDKYHGEENPMAYIRLIYSEGSVDYSKNNHNELINPKQALWRWTTVADYAKATKGKP